MATDQPPTKPSVSDFAELCLRSFQECLQQSAAANPRELSLCEDQLARFSIWTASIGVFAPGRASMDHRLREAPEIIEIVSGLLDSLNDRIESCSAVLKSTYENRPKHLDGNQSSLSVDRSRQTIANEISLLYRLTNTIRRASKESQNQKAAKSFQIKDDEGNDAEACLRMVFSNYILGRFPDISEAILQRLANTMVLRRKRILYRRSRYGTNPIKPKRSALQPTVTLPSIEQTGHAPNAPLSVDDHGGTSNVGPSTVESKAISATTLAADAFKKASTPSVISVTKTVALGNHEELVFPLAPTGRLKQKYKPLKRQRLEDHKAYLQALEYSGQHDGGEMAMVQQLIESRYIDRRKLIALLNNVFGPDNYNVRLKLSGWILTVPHPLTDDQLDDVSWDSENSIGEHGPIVSELRNRNRSSKPQSVIYDPNPVPKSDTNVTQIEETIGDAEQKLKITLEKDWVYCCQLIGEITCPFCFYALPSLDVVDENKWRAHVKNDLDAYVCLFDECDHPDELYNHSEGWLQHMHEHALRWRCTSKSHGVLVFDMKAKYMDHMRNNHSSYTEAQIRVLADRNTQIVGPLFESCPLCGTTEVQGPMEDHVVGHLRSLALKSLPPYEDEESEGSASERDSLATSQPQSRSTIKMDPDRYVRLSFTDFGARPRYMDNMNPFPLDAVDITIGGKSLCPEIVPIPDYFAEENEIGPWSSEDHSTMFIDYELLKSSPEVNERSWEWGMITKAYGTANAPDTDPIIQSIQREKMLGQGSVDPETMRRLERSGKYYHPPKADSIASDDDLGSLAALDAPESRSPGHRRRRGSLASSMSGSSTESPVLRHRCKEGRVDINLATIAADLDTSTFEHSREPGVNAPVRISKANKNSAYYSAKSEVHGKELLRLTRPEMESNHFGDGDYFRLLHQSSEDQPILESETPNSSISKEAFSPNYFKSFFVEERELGRGAKGVVLLVRHKLDGVPLGHFACKRIPIGDDHAWLEKILIEVQLLAKLNHPNLVGYRHIWLEEFKFSQFAPTAPYVFILQQYCNAGDLKTYVMPSRKIVSTKEQLKEQMRKRAKGRVSPQAEPEASGLMHRRLSFEEIYTIFKDIASGLAYLHGNGYIHQDLKPSNILLHQQDNEVRALISGFGEVRVDNQIPNSPYEYSLRPWGSYIAPELLNQDKDGRYGTYSTKSDVFCLGLILHFMCFGRLPFGGPGLSFDEEDTEPEILRASIMSWSGFQMSDNDRRERPDLPQLLYSTMRRLLAKRPIDRPTAEEIVNILRTEQNL